MESEGFIHMAQHYFSPLNKTFCTQEQAQCPSGTFPNIPTGLLAASQHRTLRVRQGSSSRILIPPPHQGVGCSCSALSMSPWSLSWQAESSRWPVNDKFLSLGKKQTQLIQNYPAENLGQTRRTTLGPVTTISCSSCPKGGTFKSLHPPVLLFPHYSQSPFFEAEN